jgi:2-phosphoglycerate kinase
MTAPDRTEAASNAAPFSHGFAQTAVTSAVVQILQRIAVALEKQNELTEKQNSTFEDIWLCL